MSDILLTQDDNALIVLAAGSAGCSLDEKPGTNWVQENGGLPGYICEVAKAIKGTKGTSSAIAIAVSRIKVWATGKGVSAKVQAKAVKALAQWEALRAKNAAKNVVKASRPAEVGGEYLMLTDVTSFNTDVVRNAYDSVQTAKRNAARAEAKAQGIDLYDSDVVMERAPYSWIKELWTDHIIVQISGAPGSDLSYAKVPYTVDEDNEVTFGEPVAIKQEWVEDPQAGLDDEEKALLKDVFLSRAAGPTERLSILLGAGNIKA